MSHSQYNFKNPAVKRLMKEAQELKDATDQYSAQPLEDNLFEWHFTFRGPSDSEFDGGIYHGRIILPPEYPMKPPSIMLLTPNGRFELHKKICLSISGYHPESWQPSWSIRTAILAIIGFMPTKGEGAIGALDYTPEERKILARKSQTWSCQTCGHIKQKLKQSGETSHKSDGEIKDEELAKQINFSKPTQQKETNQTSPKTAPSSSEEVPSSSTSTDGLRQRQTAPTDPSPTPDGFNPPTPPQPAPTVAPQAPRAAVRRRREEDTSPLMLIIVLSVVLAVLFLRRVDRAYDLRGNIGDFF